MTANLKAVATIRHNDSDAIEDRRVTLYTVEGDELVWAAAEGEEPYRTDVKVAQMHQAWAGRAWDLTEIVN